MPLFNLTENDLEEISTTSFASHGIKERDDLQRLLRERIEILVPNGLVIAEEFTDWEDSSRRIDLLALDQNADIVVIELKRTQDGGHSDLQALRYAAMVSKITFEQVVEAHRAFLDRMNIDADPEVRILEFLDWEEADEDRFGQEIRIVLASAEFSKELTTTVIWLNEQGIDIRCVRMKPYDNDGNVILEVQQVLPLPETQDYQVRVREKMSSEKLARRDQTERHRRHLEFWKTFLERANKKTALHKNNSPTKSYYLAARTRGLEMNYVLIRGRSRVELYICRSLKSENKWLFDQLYSRREEIESNFGSPLNWERLDHRSASRISQIVESNGNTKDKETWTLLHEDMIESMIKLDSALSPYIQKYRDGASMEMSEGTAE